MTSQPNLVCDSSTLANFKSWAQTISAFFGTAGWSQSSDTGQVNWSTIASVPGSGAYVYEIWQPNDGLTNFYLKVEYGNFSGSTNCPTIRLSIGTATNGAGGLTGTTIGPFTTNQSSFAAPSSSTTYACYLSGAAGRISMLLWRAGGNNCTQVFAVERSLNASGAYTGTHVTLMLGGSSNSSGNQTYDQQTLHFTNGPAPMPCQKNGGGGTGMWPVRTFQRGNSVNGAFNSAVGFDTVAPYIGFFDYPLTSLGSGPISNFTEAMTFTATLYGASRTFICTIANDVTRAGWPNSSGLSPMCVRFD